MAIRKPGASKRSSQVIQQKAEVRNSASGGKTKKLKLRKNPDSKFKKSKTPIVLVSIVIMLAIILLSSFFSYTYLVDKYKNPITADDIFIDDSTAVSFLIDRGVSTTDIAKSLKKEKLIGSVNLFRFLSKFNGYDSLYKAGTYKLCKGLSYDEIMVILTSKPESIRVTFPEGFSVEQVGARLEANGLVDYNKFLKTVEEMDVSKYTFLNNLTPNRDHRLEGYLFPDTYDFAVDETEEEIINAMLTRFNQLFKPDYYTKAEQLNMSVDDIVKLASIIEKEANNKTERPIIAEVFYNRLNSTDKDMNKLQSCATVQYVYKKLNKGAPPLEKVTVVEEKIDDPYNTYMYAGLPPGPICNPGLDSIEAALNPDSNNYYFFALKNDGSGTHHFSETYEEQVAFINGNS
ncbi:MAG: endolytic transglycosylase MltG [Clostridiales bacterium]|jgi:UPF0755 protein|nr:endolytic transglycosylase MltG [Clostridiales bacterium]